MSFEYGRIPKELVSMIHDELEVAASGFISVENFEYLFGTIEEFPERAGITPIDLKDKIIHMASYLVFHLVKGHPFNDGNKRTAFISFSYFLLINNIFPNYSEEKSTNAMKEIIRQINSGVRPLEAIEAVFKGNSDSNEYKLIKLLFELSGVDPNKNYESPVDIVPLIRGLVSELPEKPDKHFLIGFLEKIKNKLENFIGES